MLASPSSPRIVAVRPDSRDKDRRKKAEGSRQRRNPSPFAFSSLLEAAMAHSAIGTGFSYAITPCTMIASRHLRLHYRTIGVAGVQICTTTRYIKQRARRGVEGPPSINTNHSQASYSQAVPCHTTFGCALGAPDQQTYHTS